MTPAHAEAKLVETIASFRHDPLGHVQFSYPWGEPETELAHEQGPRTWQRAILERIGEKLRVGAAAGPAAMEAIREAVASGHGIGKSALIAWIAKWALDTMVDAKVVVTANTDRQLQTKTSPELAKWHRLSITSHWFVSTATALYSADPRHEKTWRCDLIPWSEHNTEAFQGLHNKRKRIVLLFDEASKIADKVWEAAEGALTDFGTEILWIVFGNPTRATGRFRECFRRFRHRWHTTNIDARQVEGTNKKQFDQWVADFGLDSDFVKIRVRGMFPAMSPKQFISQEDVDKARGKHLREEQYNFAAKIIAVEPAWTGDDELVIGLRQGLMFRILATMPKNDNDLQVGAIVARYEDELEADAVFVDGGFGTGIISYGRTLQRNWFIVWFADKATDPGCLNKRSEIWKLSRDWLKEGGALPDDQILCDDAIGPEIVPRVDGKLQLEAKEHMKERGIPSPNRWDCLALTFAHPVAKRHPNDPLRKRGMQHEYDPFEVAVA